MVSHANLESGWLLKAVAHHQYHTIPLFLPKHPAHSAAITGLKWIELYHESDPLVGPYILLTAMRDRSSIELKENTIIIVLGASGDLAKKKTVCREVLHNHLEAFADRPLLVSRFVWTGMFIVRW